VIQAAALALGVAEQIDVDAVLAALEVQIDQSTRAAAASGVGREQGIVGANLLAHDDYLVPLPGGSPVACRFQSLCRLQESILVAPNEVDLQELQPQVAPVRLALEGNAHQVGGLIVQAVGHVKIGFGQRIALVQIDRALARHGVVGRFDVRVRIGQVVGRLREFRHRVLAGLLHQE